MKSKIVLIISKIIYKILRLIGKNGGNVLGIISLTLDKHILKYFKIKGKVIAITGTNGKTSTTNLIKNILELTGAKVMCNSEGNNLDTGIASLLIKNSDTKGNVECDYLVLETDEHYVPIVYKEINLDTLVVLNFFRDQLDRAAEIDILIKNIYEFLKTYNNNLVLNLDDPNVLRLAYANKENKNIKYYNVSKNTNTHEHMTDKGEGRFCPFCGERLKYDYYQYSHIGKFKCPNNDFGGQKSNLTIEVKDPKEGKFKYKNKTFHTKYNTIYTMYNMGACFLVGEIYNIDTEILKVATQNFELNNGRLETFVINKNISLLNLAKNPAGAQATIQFMNQDEDEKELLFVLNDNLADGKDVSWIWDINFSILNNVSRIITSGTRAHDIAVRIKNSGYDYKKIECYPKIEEAINNLYKTDTTKYLIFNYTAVTKTRQAVIDYKNRVDKNDI